MEGDLLTGSRLAGYRIEHLAGRGGMGVVYLAEHVHLGRRVALKVLAPDLADDSGFRERFIRESRIAATIEHPNVLPVYDAGEADGRLYIAMRFVEGMDLHGMLGQGELTPEHSVDILSRVAGALDAAHALGLVHRDVKPANILIERPGEASEHVFLTDFGLTKPMGGADSLTRSGTFVGTLHYIAPEQIQGAQLDGRADVYALGCVLFECLTGSVPFPKDSEVAVMFGHLQEPPPAATSVRADLPPAIDAVVARAMAKERDDRYGTCSELAAAARAALAGSPLPAPPPPSKALRPPPEPGKPPAPTRARRQRRLIAGVVAALLVAGAAVAAVLLTKHHGAAAGAGQSPSPSHVSLPPPVPGVRNGRIAFVSGNDIASVNPNGSAKTFLTSSSGRAAGELDGEPVWSPDGTRIAFIRTNPTGPLNGFPNRTLSVEPVAANGTPGSVTALGTGVDDTAPAWSHDSGTVAFNSRLGGSDGMFVVQASSGAKPRRLAPVVTDSETAWSPDGTFVAFVSPANHGDIRFAALGGGARIVPISGPGKDFEARWSPDGKKVCFVSNRTGDEEVYVRDASGGTVTNLSNGPGSKDHDPVWSPDGTRIAFESDRDGNQEIYVVDVATGALTRLTNDPGKDDDPVWSPDGTKIAFSSDRTGNTDVYVMDAEGTHVVDVSNDPLPDITPTWQSLPL